ncbi:glutathione synthetase ATP-binding domain-like protein [Choiromyces venosus 120613-1]|uniref:Glutathione synthetase ATP-binding domain-like protein n=1 Tax=Choiromyces venosus 120613-1 TaxID=1336337 RepID=A0A3N4JSJ9_9PEZI|nr:glutathione synthetase ATP-binding domain-like protein [Choiromyces venosus 120613-1]
MLSITARRRSSLAAMFFSSTPARRSVTSIALLHQALPPPVVNGSFKPPKPGGFTPAIPNPQILTKNTGYKDACADIAWAVQSLNDPTIRLTTPQANPDPATDEHWSFPDTQPGILAAVAAGANTLWANTSLFAAHPLATTALPSATRIIANPPKVVDIVDDKAFTNKLLQNSHVSIPKSWLLERDDARSVEKLSQMVYDLPYPVMLKPVRGRGSEDVELIDGFVAMLDRLDALFEKYGFVLIEEFLEGEEGTVTICPDPAEQSGWLALPIVCRSEQVDGVVPWNGHVPVTQNSSVIPLHEEDEFHRAAKQECIRVAQILNLTSVARIDIRRKSEEGGQFFLFDVNLKPNLTGAGRPGRDDQDSLCAMAAKEYGWGYPEFVRRCIATARLLEEVRAIEPPKAVPGSLENFTIWEAWKGV